MADNEMPAVISPYPLNLIGKVVKTLGPRQVSHAKAASVEGRRQRLRRIGVLDVGAGNGRVDSGNDAPELRSGRKVRVVADGRDIGCEVVEVLLSSDECRGAGNDLGVVA